MSVTAERFRTAALRRGRRMPRPSARTVGAALTATFVLVGVLAPLLAPFDPFAVDGPPLAAPSGAHPFGTDALGRDMLSGVIHGVRTSLVVGLAGGALLLAIGFPVGLVSGLRGGRTDHLLMRFTETIQVLPRFFVALVVIAMYGPGLDRLVLVLGFTSWPILARVVRSETLALREREFIQAARADGATTWQIIWWELTPNVVGTAAVYVGLAVAQLLLIEAGLGFLGLGDPNAVSLGFLASRAQQFLRAAWWMSVFPGLALVLVVLGLNLLAEGRDEAHLGRIP